MFRCLLLGLLALLVLSGCSNERDRGRYHDADRPRAVEIDKTAPKEPAKSDKPAPKEPAKDTKTP
jgi:hypothetical protein